MLVCMMTQLPSLCILKNRHVLDLHRQLEIFNELQRRIQKIIQKEGGRPPPHPTLAPNENVTFQDMQHTALWAYS